MYCLQFFYFRNKVRAQQHQQEPPGTEQPSDQIIKSTELSAPTEEKFSRQSGVSVEAGSVPLLGTVVTSEIPLSRVEGKAYPPCWLLFHYLITNKDFFTLNDLKHYTLYTIYFLNIWQYPPSIVKFLFPLSYHYKSTIFRSFIAYY